MSDTQSSCRSKCVSVTVTADLYYPHPKWWRIEGTHPLWPWQEKKNGRMCMVQGWNFQMLDCYSTSVTMYESTLCQLSHMQFDFLFL